MKIAKIFLPFLFVLTFYSQASLAGGATAGNGGHGVVCLDISLAVLLDFYEFEKLNDINIDRYPLGPQEGPFYRLSTRALVKKVYNRYIENLINLTQDEELLKVLKDPTVQNLVYRQVAEYRLPQTPSWPAVDTGRCEIVQLGVQVAEGDRFVVYLRDDLYAYMNYVELAGLVLHETLHRYFHAHQPATQTTQQALRQLVGYAASGFGASKKNKQFYLKNKETALQLIKTKEPQTFIK